MRVEKKVEISGAYAATPTSVTVQRANHRPQTSQMQQRRDSLNEFAERALDRFDKVGETAVKLGFGPDSSGLKKLIPGTLEGTATAAEVLSDKLPARASQGLFRKAANKLGTGLLKVTGKALNATTGILSVAATFHLERKHSDGPLKETPKAFIKATAKTALSTFVVGAAAGAATVLVGGVMLPVVAGVGAAIGVGMAFDGIFGK